MNAQLVTTIAENRTKQRGWKSFDLRVRTICLNEGDVQYFQIVGALWMLLEAGEGVRVSSGSGEWDKTQTALNELVDEHEGQIEVENRGPGRQFLHVVEVSFLHSDLGLPVR